MDLRGTPKLMRLIKWIRTVALGLVWAETCYLPSNRYATGTQETMTDDVRDGAVNNSRKKKNENAMATNIFQNLSELTMTSKWGMAPSKEVLCPLPSAYFISSPLRVVFPTLRFLVPFLALLCPSGIIP